MRDKKINEPTGADKPRFEGPRKRKASTMTKSKETVAIIGGGIAGLYAAWRIVSDGKNDYEVCLYESSERVGGRIHSQEISGIPFKAELGAMRFRPNHHLLNALLAQLRIPVRGFDVEDPVYYVRGRRLTLRELESGKCKSCGAGMPFYLKADEQGRSPGDLVKQAVDEAIGKLTFVGLKQRDAQRLMDKLANGIVTPETWRTVKECGRFGDVPLYNIGFWNLLHHFLSNEAFVMLHDLLSLDSILGNWNAAEAIPWFLSDFANNDFLMIPGGTDTVVDELEKSLKSHNVPLHTETEVRSIVYEEGKKRWEVNTKTQPPRSFDKVILALPKRALEIVKVENGESSWPPPWIHSVRFHRMFKLFLLYDIPWWIGDKLPGCDTGRVYTDLPLRQVYYFSPSWMVKCRQVAKPERVGHKVRPDFPEAKDWALVMASYSDEHYVSFWNPVLADPSLHPIVGTEKKHYHLPANLPKALKDELDEIPQNLLASERMVEKVQRQLQEIHHGINVPTPILGVFKDWGADPFAGGWHTWEVGTKPWTAIDTFLEAYPNLFLCGEAYANVQGWMESALKSAEVVLKKLNIKRHVWTKGQGVVELDSYIYH